MINDVKEYLDRKGWEYRIEGDEYVLKICPACGNSNWNFYINRNSGMYHCWICQEENENGKGHLSGLKKYLGDIATIKSIDEGAEEKDFSGIVTEYNKNLKGSVFARKYLQSRGISEKAIEHFKLGYCVKNGQEFISIPSFENGVPKLVKYRKIGKDVMTDLPKYIRQKDGKSILFNQDIFNDLSVKEIILTEGEFDAITLWDNGFTNVVGNTGGASTLKPEWYDKLVRMERVYVCYDQDDAGTGQKAAEMVARRLKQRVRNIELPNNINDINDFFSKHEGTVEQFNELIASAKEFSIPGIVSIQESLRFVYESTLTNTNVILKTPWSSINKLLKGGLRNKNLLVIGAPPKTGKTHWCLQLALFLAKQHNVPVLFYCMEMSFEELAMLAVCMNEGIYEYEYNPREAGMYSENFRDIPLYLGYDPKAKIEQIEETFREATQRFGLGLAIFDNLTWLVRGEKDVVNKTGDATKTLKSLAMELDIPIVLVAQPRKLSSKGAMNYWDFKDSAAIPADADTLCIMHREREVNQAFSDQVLFRVDAGRFTAGGETRLEFIGEKHIMSEYKLVLRPDRSRHD